jgi:hypothetical protein
VSAAVFAMHSISRGTAHHPNEVMSDETIGLDGAIRLAAE